MTEENSFVKDKLDKLLSRKTGMRVATSPTIVWFVTLYLSSLLMMIGFNIARLGFNAEGIFGGPQYYAKVFLTYGLNATSDYASPWFGGWAWIFAPFLVIFLGIPLIFLQDAGFAYNGIRQDPQGVFFYAFFKEDVYGYDINLWGLKGNLFYIGLIWIPIIFASINTIMVKRKYGREISLAKRFFFSFIISLIVAMQMAKMTDPNLSFNWGVDGIWFSLFENRYVNRFEVYDGAYPPMMLATLMALLQIIPMIITGLMEGGYNWYLMSKKRRELLKLKEVIEVDAEDLEVLPWEKDYLEAKQAIDKKKKEDK